MQATTYGETVKVNICFTAGEILYIIAGVLLGLDKLWIGIGFLCLALIGTTVRFGMQQQEREERRKHKQDLVNQLDTIATLQSVNSNKDPIH